MYDHKDIEKRWQEKWNNDGTYQASNNTSKPKKYILDMFPYPSGVGLHVGHPKGYIATDILSRMYRMQGFNVLHPMGWDGFGLPAEEFAIKNQIHPKTAVDQNIATFKKQLSIIGLDYDWNRELNTTDPAYYKWTQWIFLQMYKKGLAFESNEPINWCPSCKTGLANEDLEDGKCERCESVVEKKPLRQWVLRITDYAERMLVDLDKLDKWPESVKTSQRNWIGKSEGAEIVFSILEPEMFDINTGPNDDAFREGEETVDRNNVVVVIQHPEKDEFLCAKWKKVDWQGFVTGGIEEGQSVEQTALQEVIEETGYKNPKIVKVYDKSSHGLFWHVIKNKNRKAHYRIVHVKLENLDRQEPSKEEQSIADFLWIPKNEVDNFLKREDMKYPWRVVTGQDIMTNVKVFTTRPETLFGVTYVVLAPENHLVQELKTSIKNWDEIQSYIEETKKKSQLDRQKGEKTGVKLKGIFAVNPANGEEVPVWIADYVLTDYGTGAVMAVPAHDERDNEFAKKFDLEIRQVIAPFIYGEGSFASKPELKTLERRCIDAIIEHPTDGTFLLQKDSHIHFVGGGTDDEDLITALKREIIEETGYVNFEIKTKIVDHIIAQGYRVTKEINQITDSTFFHVKLIDEERVKSEVEDGKHTIEWVRKEDIDSKIEWVHHLWGWKIFQGEVFKGSGKMVNSGKFDGLSSEEAGKKIIEKVGGEFKTTYKLQDWVFSRQRYWGEPIPIVHAGGKAYSLSEDQLPLELPQVEKYKPSDSGESPLADIHDWVHVRGYLNDSNEFIVSNTSPNGETLVEGRRETNTMPQWAGSCWYYLRYVDPKNEQAFASQDLLKYWQPVDVYVGGMEHATRHLIYARFWHKFLYDIGAVTNEEPFMELHAIGLILAEDGRKMSKRWGNVVNPDEMVERFGADAFRLYQAFMGPFDDAIAWNTNGMVGTRRFVERVVRMVEELKDNESKLITCELHKLIKKISNDIANFKFNTVVSSMMIFVNMVEKEGGISRESYLTFMKVLAPLAPHITEELWYKLGNKTSIHVSSWPKFDESKLFESEITIVVQVNGKVRATLMVAVDSTEELVKELAMQDENVQKYVEGTPKKIIYVKDKLLNIVI